MADVAAPLDTTSTAVASSSDATPSPSSSETGTSTPATAGDTAAADPPASARDVWREMQAAESGGTPPDAPQAPSSAQAAIPPDGTPEAPGSQLPTNGAIPLDRHKAVVTNTRRKTLAEYGIEETQQADGTFAPSVKPEAVKTAVNLFQWLQKDPRGFVRMVQSQLGEDAPAQAAAPAAKPAEDAEPEPDVPLQDGRFVYSAEQLRARDQWRERKLMAQLDEKYGPIRDAHDMRVITERETATARAHISEARTWPLFKELRPHIEKIIANGPTKLTAASLPNAYIAAYREHGERLLREKWDAERTGQLLRKADASTVQPGAPRPSTPRPDTELSSRDIVRQEYRRHAAG